MKIYARADGFEVNDVSGKRDIASICKEFGGAEADWADVTADRKAKDDAAKAEKASAKEAKNSLRASAMNKLQDLGLAKNEINALIGA